MAFTERISAACGRRKAELVLKHAKIINVFTESIEDGDVAVEDGVIVGIGSMMESGRLMSMGVMWLRD